MSYQVLARKWRPATFSEVTGQQHVLRALANGLSLGRIHHAYLFSGTRGVGKTTIARLLAKGLNCEAGVSATPCGVCESCQQISQGRFVDLIEIDAASRTKVEDTRELLDNVQYAPVRGRYKVYLIDEVHMLSRHSFNALLKTLEEPPAHVKFLLATTDPQKLPVTILSRCLQFHLRALDVGQISGRLEYVLNAEQVEFEPRALLMLARAADGSLRDALSLTDQAIASGAGQVTESVVSTMLGTLEDQQALSLIESLIQGNGEQMLALVDDAASYGVEWDALLVEMAQLLHRIAMGQLVPLASSAGQENLDRKEIRLSELARILPPADVQLYYQILLLGRKELPWAPERRMGVEMTLLRALAFHPKTIQPASASLSGSLPLPVVSLPEVNVSSVSVPVSQIPLPTALSQVLQARDQIQRVQQQVQQKQQNEPLPAPQSSLREKQLQSIIRASRQPAVPDPKPESQPESERQPADYRWQAKNLPAQTEKSQITPQTVRSALEHDKTPELTAKIAAQVCECDAWAAQITRLNIPKLVQQLALNSYKQQQGNQVYLWIRPHVRQLNTAAAQKALTQALSELQKEHIELIVQEDDNLQHRTPQEWRDVVYAEMLAKARETIITDSNIQNLCQLFDAVLDENSIRPI